MDQHQEQLKSYIRQQLQSGVSSDEIATQLRGAGWSNDLVYNAFHALQQEVMPSHMATHQATHEPSTAAGHHEHHDHTVSPGATPEANGQRRGRIKTSFLLLKQSTKLLFGNKYLLRYMLMTGVWVLVVATVFIAITLILGATTNLMGDPNSEQVPPLAYVIAFLYYIAIYFVINLYAAGLTVNILDIFKGERRPYHAYMKLARSKAGPLFVFSVIAATVGILLEYIAERFKLLGYIVAWVLGALWSLGTMFVVPIIVTSENPSAPRSIKQSIQFFKRTWGENIASKVGVSIALFFINLLVLIAFIIFAVGLVSAFDLFGFFVALVLWVLVVIALAVLGIFANSLVNVALFHYAAYHEVPPAFSADLLNSVFVKRKRRFFKKIKE